MRKLLPFVLLPALGAIFLTLLWRSPGPETALQSAIAAYDRHEYKAARAMLAPLAESGVVKAQYLLGKLDERGRGGRRDVQAAGRWYRLAAEQEHGWSAYRLAVLIYYRNLMPDLSADETDAEAARWFRTAAHAGVPPAQSMYAYLLATGRGVAQDEVASVEWARRAAKKGDPDGQYALANALSDGRGTAKDNAEAARWYMKAVVQNIGSATQMSARRRLIRMWEEGVGPWRDAAAYVAWLADVANLGDLGAQLQLARLYEEGRIVPRDLEASTSWYAMAAEGNTAETAGGWANVSANALALRKLAALYLEGERLPGNPAEALRLLRAAAGRNDVEAQIQLGEIFAEGRVAPAGVHLVRHRRASPASGWNEGGHVARTATPRRTRATDVAVRRFGRAGRGRQMDVPRVELRQVRIAQGNA